MKKQYYQFFNRIIILLFFASTLYSCDNHRNASDMRQIMAKNEVLSQLHKISSFDITGFSEATVRDTLDANFKKMIRYELDITYIDSNKSLQNKKGVVFFTPDGKTVVHSQITER